MDKIKILFYSGHNELVGGDAQYLFNLVDNLNPDKYEVELYTDKNYLFAERAKQWLKRELVINYLDTRPILFKKNLIKKIYERIESRQDNNRLVEVCQTILNMNFFLDRSVYRWLNYLYYRVLEIITLAKLRYIVHHALIFYRLFKNKKGKIDIIHFNNGGYPAKTAVLVAIIVARFIGFKNIVMTALSMARRRRWYCPSDYIFDFFIPKICRKVITNSQYLQTELFKRRKFPLNKIAVILLGVNDAANLTADEVCRKKQELELSPDQPLLMIAGAIYGEAKGHNVLLKAMLKVKKFFPDVKLLIAGNGKGLPDLQRTATALDINDCVKFLGYRQDIDALNSIIDIAVVPSIASEGVPFTCLEALRAGKPLITTDVGGCAEAVKNGLTGLIVEKNNPEALAKALIALLNNKQLMIDMGRSGRKMFEEKFCLSAIMKSYEQFYAKLLN